MTRQIRFAMAAFAVLALAAPASAQATIGGGLRLHLETTALQIDSTSPEEGDSETSTSIGPAAGGLGLGIGYAIDENLVVGGNLVLNHRDGGGDNDGVLMIGLMPYLEYLLGDGDVRPFIGGSLILQMTSAENTSLTSLGLAGIGGVHIFLNDGFSFDVGGRLYFTSNSFSVETPAGDVDSSSTSIGLMVLLGVSGWGV